MNLRNIGLLVIAVVVAGMAALMTRNWLISQREAMRPKPVAAAPQAPATMVLVAKAHLKPGSFVQQAHLDWVAWPKEGVVKGFIVKTDKVKIEDLIGSVARTTINPGEPILEVKFVKPGDRGFMAAVLTPGNRAATVPINATSGQAGFVFPGDRVDLILTSKFGEGGEGGEGKRNYAATILEDLRVLAIDQKTENAKGEHSLGRTATLEVTPRQAELVQLGMQMGNLALSLRPLSGESDAADASNSSRQGESVIVAEAVDESPESKKVKQDKGNSYVVDKDLRFMVEDRAKSKPGVTVLRGTAEK
ncbi:MAG: Flp pilus assembly protein CpaB [Rhodospirillales bacterium]|nr:Flp pilus assembly protein CpaB [Rhodospirillales bacterium]